MNETLKTLMERRSVRSYKEEQVPEDILQQILEAGEYAPSGMGMQSAVMVVVRDKDTINQISRMNAAVMGNDGDPFYGAPTVVIVFGDSTRGVDSCWIHRAKEVFLSEEGKTLMKKWGLGEEYVGIGNCILGYSNEPHPQAKARKDGYIIRV